MFAAKPGVLFRFISPAAFLLSSVAFAASCTAGMDKQEGLLALTKGGASALSSAFACRGKQLGLGPPLRVACLACQTSFLCADCESFS